MVEEIDSLVIRNFKPGDLKQTASIMASSFRDDYLKLVNLPEDKMVDFLIETGEAFPHSFPGYIVAEKNGELLGLIILRWPRQNKPKVRFQISKVLHYGWFTTIKLLIMRYLFPEKPAKGTCHVAALAVIQKARRKGIAIKLLCYGKKLALSNGLNRYTLNADASNDAAFTLYKKTGFKIEKRLHNLMARWLLGVKEWLFMSQYLDPPV